MYHMDSLCCGTSLSLFFGYSLFGFNTCTLWSFCSENGVLFCLSKYCSIVLFDYFTFLCLKETTSKYPFIILKNDHFFVKHEWIFSLFVLSEFMCGKYIWTDAPGPVDHQQGTPTDRVYEDNITLVGPNNS